MTPRRASERALRLVIFLVSLHSFVLGFTMMVFPSSFLALVGWPALEGPFFPSQAGIFLMLLSLAYFLGLEHRGMVRFIILSKMAALAFLLFHFLFLGAPSVILPTALLDGVMGSALWVLYHLSAGSVQYASSSPSPPTA